MWGETTSDYLLDVAAGERHWIADFVVVKRSPARCMPISRPFGARYAMPVWNFR